MHVIMTEAMNLKEKWGGYMEGCRGREGKNVVIKIESQKPKTTTMKSGFYA